jgi:hypothetical protein
MRNHMTPEFAAWPFPWLLPPVWQRCSPHTLLLPKDALVSRLLKSVLFVNASAVGNTDATKNEDANIIINKGASNFVCITSNTFHRYNMLKITSFLRTILEFFTLVENLQPLKNLTLYWLDFTFTVMKNHYAHYDL